MIIKRNKAVKYRAYPTQTQANLIDRTISCVNAALNLCDEGRRLVLEELGGSD